MRLPSVIVLAGLLWLGACHATGPMSSSLDEFNGTWVVTKINNYATITTSEANMKALIGAKIIIGNDKVIDNGELACELNPKTDTVTTVDTAKDMPPQDGISAASAGLPSRALKLQTSCQDFYKNGDKLIFGERGAYYTAERSTSK